MEDKIMKRKIVAIILTLLTFSMSVNIFAADKIEKSGTEKNKSSVTITKGVEEDMSEREKAAVEKFNELYKGAKIPKNIAESELYTIVNNLIYGDIYSQGQLTDEDREEIALAVMTTLGTTTMFKTHVYSALNAGLTPVEITETIYHCTPYVGSAKALEAIEIVNSVFNEKGIKMPESTATVMEENR